MAEQSQRVQAIVSDRYFDHAVDLIEGMAKIGYWRWRIGDKLPIWSPGLYAMFGVNPAEPAPPVAWVVERIHPDDRHIFNAARERARTSREPFHFQVRINEPEPCRIIEIHRGAEFDENHQAIVLVSFFQDISERREVEAALKAAQEKAELANRSKSRFLANMSHELRTPLNAIIGFGDILQRQLFGALGSERYVEYAKLIYSSGGLLLEIISDILDMAKIEAGKMTLSFERVNLVETLQECVTSLQEKAAERQITLGVSFASDKLSMEGDKRTLKQILLNLLSNAVKFSVWGGKVSASCTEVDGNIIVTIKDDGIGIPASEIPRLGKPFERVGGDPTRASGGTGLGLALARSLSQLHGGSIDIASEEGIGTTVTVVLPTSQPVISLASDAA